MSWWSTGDRAFWNGTPVVVFNPSNQTVDRGVALDIALLASDGTLELREVPTAEVRRPMNWSNDVEAAWARLDLLIEEFVRLRAES